MIGPSSLAALLAAIARGRNIQLASSLLREGRLVAALEAAGERGASVRVDLEDRPYAGDSAVRVRLAEQNSDVAGALQQHHVDARLRGAGQPPLHLKAAIVDGIAYLDDRNWPECGGDSIVTIDDAADVAALRSAIGGAPQSGPHLATIKGDALALETYAIASSPPSDVLSCETESIGGSAVVDALCARARRGGCVRLLVDRHDLGGGKHVAAAAALRTLADAGVDVRACDGAEKFALAGKQAWLGSANATTGEAGALDWGLQTRSRAVIDRLQAHLDARWAGAGPASQP